MYRMDITKEPIEKQKAWLAQRGWQPDPRRTNVFLDPNTRTGYYLKIALQRALGEIHIGSDTEMNPVVPKRKDDAPEITVKNAGPRK
jgi:hypothetical protein